MFRQVNLRYHASSHNNNNPEHGLSYVAIISPHDFYTLCRKVLKVDKEMFTKEDILMIFKAIKPTKNPNNNPNNPNVSFLEFKNWVDQADKQNLRYIYTYI